MPGWQQLYSELKSKNFEIISVAQDTGGVKDAGPWITAAKPEYTALIDTTHLVTRLYNMVNVPTAVWINEQGRIVRPNEVAYVDNRYTGMHKLEAEPYLAAIRDWAEKGDKSSYAFSEQQLKTQMEQQKSEWATAAAEFALAEYLYRQGEATASIAHYKTAQKLNPDNWNYKRQAWALSDAEREYGTTFMKEVQKLNGKPYYAPRKLPDVKKP